MTVFTNRKNKKTMQNILILFILFILITACGNLDQESTEKPTGDSKGFTFLDLHANSVLTDKIQDDLAAKLGSAAIETRTTLDLEMHYNGFLETYIRELNELNQRLNFEKGYRIRIEHHTIKLIYRYAASFNYVELFFSNDTKKPLLFRIKAKKDGADIVKTFRNKYGTPEEKIWPNKESRSLVWKKNKDVLVISLFSDRYGNPRYEIMICHVENIEALLAAEEKERKQREKDRSPGGPSAF